MDEIVELMAKAQHDDCVQGDHEWGERADVQDYWRQSVRAALSALHEAGYRVVPNEPTDEMLRQGAMTFYENRHLTTYAHRIPYIYRAMLAASPVKKG